MADSPTYPHMVLTINDKVVKGDSTEVSSGDIQLYSLQWGVSNPVDTSTGAQSSHASWSDLTITKRIDKSSPEIVKAMCTNLPVKVEIKIYKPPVDGGSKDVLVYTLVCDFGRISSYSTGSAGGGGWPEESVSIAFRKVSYTVGTVSHIEDWQKKK